MRTERQKISESSAWACYTCEKFAADPVFVQNRKTGDLIAIHRECLVTLVQVLRAPERPEARREATRARVG
jgi:hypothetical protein